jgi:hypothetical protein
MFDNDEKFTNKELVATKTNELINLWLQNDVSLYSIHTGELEGLGLI